MKTKQPLAEGQVFRVIRKNMFAPVGALGEVLGVGIGARAKVWYSARFMNWQNPDGFMDCTMFENEIRTLNSHERGERQASKGKLSDGGER